MTRSKPESTEIRINEDRSEMTIPLGDTWKGFDFVKVKKYKRKRGFKITAVRKTWRGKYITLHSESAETADDVIRVIQSCLLPIFEVPDHVKKEIKRFCGLSDPRQ